MTVSLGLKFSLARLADQSAHLLPASFLGETVEFGLQLAPAVHVEDAPVRRGRPVERELAPDATFGGVLQAAGLLFFALGLEREIILAFARSLDAFPAGSFLLTPAGAEQILRLASGMFSVGLRLAMPALALFPCETSTAIVSLMMTQADAPSESWLALPALIVLPSNTGLMLASPSAVVSGRGPSSLVSVISLNDTCLVSLSMTAILVLNGTISSLKRPP